MRPPRPFGYYHHSRSQYLKARQCGSVRRLRPIAAHSLTNNVTTLADNKVLDEVLPEIKRRRNPLPSARQWTMPTPLRWSRGSLGT